MDLEWQNASEAERIILYRAIRNYLFKSRLHWDQWKDVVFGAGHEFGQGWERNFAAGRIGRPVAAQIYGWLVNADQNLAETVRQNMLALRTGPPSLELWETLLAERGNFGSLEINTNLQCRVHSGPPVERSQQKQAQVQMWRPSDTAPRVPAGVPFCIDHKLSIEGHAFGFQEVAGRWLPLPLDFENGFAVVWAGRASFPLFGGLLVDDKLYVEYEQGRRRFVIMTAPPGLVEQHYGGHNNDAAGFSAAYLNGVAKSFGPMSDEVARVELLNVIFTA